MERISLKFSIRKPLASMALFLFLGVGGGTASAYFPDAKAVKQAVALNGLVVDATGEPVIGANVVIKGTTNGAITDLDGKFSLQNASGTLVVSFIGYKTLEVPVQGKNFVKVVLQEDSELLDEVVVVGYGSQKKETLTGSVTVVGEKIFKDKGTVSNPMQALQGQVPGVRITRSSAAPGEEGWNMSIRGAVSKNTTEPLLIIDGVPASSSGELAQLNSADIESINFLKDASAAIYGSKAAGGVILVTTKRSSAGKTKIEYSGSYTHKIVGLQPRLMSYDDWMEGVAQARRNDGYAEDNNWIRYAQLAMQLKGSYIDLTHGQNPVPIPGYEGVADMVFQDVNWTDVLWGNAGSTKHDLSISGGGEKSNYRLSLGFLYDGSTLQYGNNSNQRYNVRFTNNYNVTERFTLTSVVSASRQKQVSPTMINNVLSTSTPHPGFPISTIDGKPYAWGSEYGPNWLAELGGDNELLVTTFNVNETFKFKILDELNLVATFGYSTNHADRDSKFLPIQWYSYNGEKLTTTNGLFPAKSAGYYTKSSSRTDSYSASAYAHYSKSFGNKHNVGVMLGAQYDYQCYDYAATKAINPQAALDVLNGSGDIYIDKVQKNEQAIMSYFSRLNYDFLSKYLLEANLRYDGSSKFQPENRWNFFYGVSGGWRMMQEPFMEPLKNIVDELKLKLSYGVVGNQSGIGLYDGVQLYNFSANSGAMIGGVRATTIGAVGELVSKERTWEKIHNYNIGLDFTLLNNRLTGSIDFYKKKNNNMLVSRLYPGVLGGKAPATNVGKFESEGCDLNLTWRSQIGKVSYHIGGTWTYMTNKLKSGGEDVFQSGYNAAINGYPLNSVFGYRYVGKIQNEKQLKKYKSRYLMSNSIGMPANIRLGDNMYDDVNGDGKLTQDDLIYLGSDDPKISFSFNAGMEWKGLDFAVTFQGVAKRTICRELDSWKVPFQAIFLNTSDYTVGNVWSPETPNNRYPAYSNDKLINTYNYQPSTFSVDNGAYLRLKDVIIGYTFPKSVYAAMGNFVNNLRVYVSGSDLWEKADIQDKWDPEASRKVSGKNRYPFNRTVTIGLNATF